MPSQSPTPHSIDLSLVIATVGRSSEMNILFDSLLKQVDAQDGTPFEAFEIIIVDQNGDDRLARLVAAREWPVPVRHLHLPTIRGASRARNIGLREAQGEIVLFPDDDCWYPANFLNRGVREMRERELDFYCGRAANEEGRSINGRFETTPCMVSLANVWTTQIEWTVFFRRSVVQAIGGYNEDIGVGASTPWQSGEGQELTLRAMKTGARGYYDPTLQGHHAEINSRTPDARTIAKARGYGRGMGRVLRISGCRASEFFGWWLLRPLGGIVAALGRGRLPRARYFVAVASGRLEGWLGRTFS